MPPAPIFDSYEDSYRFSNPNKPVPSNGVWTNEPGACYIWEPKPGTYDPYDLNDPETAPYGGNPAKIVSC